jgi:hypothetical protein
LVSHQETKMSQRPYLAWKSLARHAQGLVGNASTSATERKKPRDNPWTG